MLPWEIAEARGGDAGAAGDGRDRKFYRDLFEAMVRVPGRVTLPTGKM